MRSTVLFSCAGGAAGLTALRLTRAAEPTLRLVATDQDQYSYATELADDFCVVDADVSDDAYGDALLDVIERHEIRASIPCYSGELSQYLRIAPRLLERNVRIPFIDQQGHDLVIDKVRLYGALESADLPVPRYALLDSDGLRRFPQNRVVLKMRCGAGSRGLHFAEPGEHLPPDVRCRHIAYVEQVHANGVEVSLDGVVLSNERIVGPVARVRLATRDGLAITSESVDLGDVGADVYRCVAAVIRTRGPLNVQAFFHNGSLVGVTDVNPRFPAGGMALVAAMGLNMPATVLRDLIVGPEDIALRLPPFRQLRHYRGWRDVIVDGAGK